ncbi:MAG: integrin alpha [Candidatus Midichloria sp.]
MTINGISTGGYAGFSIDSVGDMNNDGKNDIIIGAYQAGLGDKEQVGQVIYAGLLGKQAASTTTVSTTAMTTLAPTSPSLIFPANFKMPSLFYSKALESAIVSATYS